MVTVGIDPYTIDEEEDWKYPDLAKLLDIPVEKINRAAALKIRTSKEGGSKISKVRWVKLKDEVDEATYRKNSISKGKGCL